MGNVAALRRAADLPSLVARASTEVVPTANQYLPIGVLDSERRIGQSARVGAISRRGIVFIAWIDNDDEPGFYSGYWDGGGRGPGKGFLEQMPETPSTTVALEWAQVRSDRVQIRPHWDPSSYYSAGEFVYPALQPLRPPPSDE